MNYGASIGMYRRTLSIFDIVGIVYNLYTNTSKLTPFDILAESNLGSISADYWPPLTCEIVFSASPLV